MAYGLAWMMLQPTVPVFLVERLDVAYADVANARGLIYFTMIAAFSHPFGRLLDRVGPLAVSRLAFAVLTLFPLLLASARGVGMVFAAFVVFGLGMAAVNLGWTTGPIHFARERDSSGYMGAHVALVGRARVHRRALRDLALSGQRLADGHLLARRGALPPRLADHGDGAAPAAGRGRGREPAGLIQAPSASASLRRQSPWSAPRAASSETRRRTAGSSGRAGAPAHGVPGSGMKGWTWMTAPAAASSRASATLRPPVLLALARQSEDEVDVRDETARQRVADRAPHVLDGVAAPERLELRRAAGLRADHKHRVRGVAAHEGDRFGRDALRPHLRGKAAEEDPPGGRQRLAHRGEQLLEPRGVGAAGRPPTPRRRRSA